MKKYLLLILLVLSINVFATASTTEQMQKTIHDYIMNNPQVIVQALQQYQQQQAEQALAKTRNAIPENAKAIFQNKAQPFAGNPNGDVILAEFFDYQCPHCKAMGKIVADLLKADTNLKVVYVEWPIYQGASLYAAQAALAAQKQGKFLPFHEALTAKGYPLNKDEVLKIAKSVGVDTNKLINDMKDKNIDQQIKTNFALAQKLNLIGTPAFFITNAKMNKFDFIGGQTTEDDLRAQIAKVRSN